MTAHGSSAKVFEQKCKCSICKLVWDRKMETKREWYRRKSENESWYRNLLDQSNRRSRERYRMDPEFRKRDLERGRKRRSLSTPEQRQLARDYAKEYRIQNPAAVKSRAQKAKTLRSRKNDLTKQGIPTGRRRWTQEEESTALAMYREGYSRLEIALQIGRTLNSVNTRIPTLKGLE